MSRKSGYSGVCIAEEKLSLSDVVDMNKNVFNTKINTAVLLSFLKTKLRPTEKTVALVMFVG
jgi:hypothetical protein